MQNYPNDAQILATINGLKPSLFSWYSYFYATDALNALNEIVRLSSLIQDNSNKLAIIEILEPLLDSYTDAWKLHGINALGEVMGDMIADDKRLLVVSKLGKLVLSGYINKSVGKYISSLLSYVTHLPSLIMHIEPLLDKSNYKKTRQVYAGQRTMPDGRKVPVYIFLYDTENDLIRSDLTDFICKEILRKGNEKDKINVINYLCKLCEYQFLEPESEYMLTKFAACACKITLSIKDYNTKLKILAGLLDYYYSQVTHMAIDSLKSEVNSANDINKLSLVQKTLKPYNSNPDVRLIIDQAEKKINEIKRREQDEKESKALEENRVREQNEKLAYDFFKEKINSLLQIKKDNSNKITASSPLDQFLLELMKGSNWNWAFITKQSDCLEYGYTALHIAAMIQDKELITQLIKKRWDVEARNNYGKTFLDLLAKDPKYFANTALFLAKENLIKIDFLISKSTELYDVNSLLLKQLKKEQHYYNVLESERKSNTREENRDLQERLLLQQVKEISKEDVIRVSVYNVWKKLERIPYKQQGKEATDLKELIKNSIKQPEELLDHSKYNSYSNWLWSNTLNESAVIFSPIKKIQSDIQKVSAELKEPAYKNIRQELKKINEYYNTYIEAVCKATSEQRRNLYTKKTLLQSEDLRGELLYRYLEKTEAETLIGKLAHSKTTIEEKEDEKEDEKAKEDKHGTHVVKRLNGVYYKFMPHAPGVEFMVDRLNTIIGGYLSAPTRLIGIKDNAGKTYPFQASRGVVGTELQYVIEQRPELISENKLDSENFSSMIALSLLTDPCDGKPDNYMVELDQDKQGNIHKFKIIGIDNDIAFADPVIKLGHGENKGKHIINVKNVLYFFPQMHEQIDPKFRKAFLSLTPELVLIEWMQQLHKQNNSYDRLLEEGIFSKRDYEGDPNAKEADHGLQLPIKFKSGTISKLYTKLRKMQDCMQKEELTHWELFQAVERVPAKYYAAVQKDIKETLASLNALVNEHGIIGALEQVKAEIKQLQAEMREIEKTKINLKSNLIKGDSAKEAAYQEAAAAYTKLDIQRNRKNELCDMVEAIGEGKALNEIMQCLYQGLYRPAARVLEEYSTLNEARKKDDTGTLTQLVLKTAKNIHDFEAGRNQTTREAAEELIANIDFTRFRDPRIELSMLDNIVSRLNFIENLTIRNCSVVDDKKMRELAESFSEIKSIRLVELSSVTAKGVTLLIENWKELDASRKIIIGDCEQIDKNDWEILGKNYKEFYIRCDGHDFAIGKQSKAELFYEALNLKKYNREFFDYILSDCYVDVRHEQLGSLTALQISAANNQVEVVEYLLSNGAKVLEQDNRGETALHNASYSNSYEAICCLVDSIKDKDKQLEFINIKSSKGVTALDKLVKHNKPNIDAIKYLHKLGGILGNKENQGLLNELLDSKVIKQENNELEKPVAVLKIDDDEFLYDQLKVLAAEIRHNPPNIGKATLSSTKSSWVERVLANDSELLEEKKMLL